MPRSTKSSRTEEEEKIEEKTDYGSAEEIEHEPPKVADPYEILGIASTATETEIKKAYRRLALIHHPDKVDEAASKDAHVKFQEIVYAYGILSDAKRRSIYDATGSLDESAGSDFSWKDYFDSMYIKAITKDMIEQDKKDYRDCGSERDDVLRFYTQSKGDMGFIFENVIHSDIIEDEERFRHMIKGAIESGEVKAYRKFTLETAASKSSRKTKAMKEAAEAEDLANKLNLNEKFISSSESSLAILIRNRNASRMDNMISNLDAKYGAGANGKKRSVPPPTSEEFEATQGKLIKKRKEKVDYH
ncbi:DnaJ domain-containing protein [Lipomyces arxii]|uniref:DnaJ domain-containing protein n=1 Tax=Lipomyces arxii TaxID=56418 RepID=UPI0034CF5E27